MLRTKRYLLTDGHGHLVEEKVRRFITILKFVVPIILIASLIGLYKFNEWNRSWNIHFQNPIQNPIVIEPVPQSQFQVNLAPRSEIITLSERLFPKAKAAELKPEDMSVHQYIVYKFGNQAVTAMAIMLAESGGNHYAINKNTDKTGSLDLGCWQLNEKWQKFTRAQAFDCKWSTDKAFEIYQEWGGFTAWSAYKNKSYQKKLPEARRIVEQNS